ARPKERRTRNRPRLRRRRTQHRLRRRTQARRHAPLKTQAARAPHTPSQLLTALETKATRRRTKDRPQPACSTKLRPRHAAQTHHAALKRIRPPPRRVALTVTERRTGFPEPPVQIRREDAAVRRKSIGVAN